MCRPTHYLTLGVCLFLANCGHSTAQVRIPTENARAALGPGDVFEVRVYGEPDLSGVYRVGSDGSIDFPLVGKVMAERRTGPEVTHEISERLAAYVKRPQVSIFVKEFNANKVFVFGEVQKPGTFPFEDGMNIIQAITLAGGFGKLADKDGTFVTRRQDGKEQRLEVSVNAIGEGKVPNFELLPGDIVYVPEALF